MLNYLQQLAVDLATAVAELPEETRGRHAAFFEAAQRPDGGFAGRAGESDLYYTGFALRSLAVLGRLFGPVAERAAGFLSQRLPGATSAIDLVSWVYGATLLDTAAGIDVFATQAADAPAAIGESLERLRRDDGGYAKTPGGAASSTYHTFLALAGRQLMDLPLLGLDRAVDFVLSQQCEGGGFREIKVAKRAGTNPTAAAIGVLKLADAMTGDVRDETVRFLAAMQTDEGGLKANTRIPLADLLSTFTGLWTLRDLEALDTIDTAAARRYVQALERPEGGFFGASWDKETDVEYTFYGLGGLAVLGGE